MPTSPDIILLVHLSAFNRRTNGLLKVRKHREIRASVSDTAAVIENDHSFDTQKTGLKHESQPGLCKTMEAAGIEPASRDASRLASTCVVGDLFLA